MKKYNNYFWIGFTLARFVPLYLLLLGFFFREHISFWTAGLPIIIFMWPVTIYMLNLKCNNCGEKIFTFEHAKLLPTGWGAAIFAPNEELIFKKCPECDAEII